MTINNIFDRFDSKVSPEPNTGCWLWTGALVDGYGQFRVDRDNVKLAHRLSYERHIGNIPAHLELDHLCRVRCCVNPEHLEPVTRRVNVRRSPIWRGNATHCPKGHPYDKGNTYFECGGNRRCRTCQLAKSAFYYRKRNPKNVHAG